MYFHAGVHAMKSRGSGKKTRSEVQTNRTPLPHEGPMVPLLKIHRRLQQRRRCCPFVAIERVLFAISRFLLRDTPSYLSTPLLFRIRSYMPSLAPGLWDFMRAKAVYAPWISSDLLFSSCSYGCSGCRTSTREASRSNNVATPIQKLALKEGVSVIITGLYKTIPNIRNREYFKKRMQKYNVKNNSSMRFIK